jgi:hypothetical protein
MRTCWKWIVVAGEVLLFGLAACAVSQAQQYPRLPVTYMQPVQNSEESPYATSDAYRTTARLVPRDGQGTVLVQRTPAREADLLPLDRACDVKYPEITALARTTNRAQPLATPYQRVNYRSSSATAAIPAAYTDQATSMQYPPATVYSAPNYSVPVVGAPQTVLRPVTPAPIVRTDVQVGTGIYGQPVIYRQGQPLRNVWRWLTP